MQNQHVKNPKKEVIEWRRSRVLEMVSKGSTLTEIAKVIGYDVSTISRDLSFIEQEAQQNIRDYVDHKLPLEYEKCLTGVNEIMRESWIAAKESTSPVEKRQWLVLAKDCYSMKLELLTNAGVIDKAIEFVTVEKNKLDRTTSNVRSNNNTVSTNDSSQQMDRLSENKTAQNIQGTSGQLRQISNPDSSFFSRDLKVEEIKDNDIQRSGEENTTRESNFKTTNRTF